MRAEERRRDVLRSGCWCEERTQPAQPLRFPVAAVSRAIVVQQGVERTEGRAAWTSTSSPSQCPGDATPSWCPSESLSLQAARQLLLIHLLLLLVDAGVGDGISPVERRDSVGMAGTVPAGACLSVPRDSRAQTTLAGPLHPPKLLSAPEPGPSTQQLQKEEQDPQNSQNSELQQPPGPSVPGL